jgi:Ser/Thr protein kinase RdoA (MazF antagonist)
MTKTTAQTQSRLVSKILDAYGVRYDRILPVQKGYRNQSFGVACPDGSMLNLILYKSEPGILLKIRAANVVSDYLAAQGFPARKTVSSKIVRLEAGGRIKYGALYEYLNGRTIPWEAYTKQHIKLLGRTMSGMHAALAGTGADMAGAELPAVTDEYLAIVNRMRRYFDDESVRLALAAKLRLAVGRSHIERFESLLVACAQLRHQQPLHMDFVRSNILFDNAGAQLRLTGILDFEKTAIGHPLFDVARTLSFLLVDCKYKTEADVRKFFLESGYNRRGATPLPRQLTAKLLERLINLFLLHDFYKFLRHNPYKFLPQNEHFMRTHKLLLKRGVVTSSTL